MTEAEFNELVDSIFERIEEVLEKVDSDADCDSSGGVLTIEFENDTTIVFSRQGVTQQLWMAARSGGYHFEYDAGQEDWRCTRSGRWFSQAVKEEFQQQGGVVIESF